jgi:uncharacterized protein RhaS with RHS repeats
MQSSRNVFFPKLSQRLLAGGMLLLLSGAIQAGSVTYTYDSLGRLAQATYSNGVMIVYVYDAAGNRTSYTVTGAP